MPHMLHRNRFAVMARTLGTGMLSYVCGCSLAIADVDRPGDVRLLTALHETSSKPDAEFLLWSQQWTLHKDRSTSYREHWRVRINDYRALGRYGDPRISHVPGSDRLTIHTAKTTLPDGTELPVPDYSYNLAATDEVAGWPQYAGWRDMVVSFSGIEYGAVVELDYEILSPPEASPWFDGQVRLDDVYSVARREIAVRVPQGSTLSHRLSGIDPKRVTDSDTTADGYRTLRWSVESLAGERDEPLSLPWARRSPRLTFSATPAGEPTAAVRSGAERSWAPTILSRVEDAARIDATVEKFAARATEHEPDPAERVRRLAKKLRDRFNVIDSPKALRGLTCRNAADVLQSNYGNTLESAALLLAGVKALGLTGSVHAVVDADRWSPQDGVAPPMAAFEGVVVRVSVDGDDLMFHPQRGEISRTSGWCRKYLFPPPAADGSQRLLACRGDGSMSGIRVTGTLSLDKNAKISGELRIRANGAYLSDDLFGDSGAQKKWVASVVDRVFGGVEVSSFTVRELSVEACTILAGVSAREGIKKIHDGYPVNLGTGPLLLNAVSLPLERSERRLEARLGTRLSEDIGVLIELPDGWRAMPMPPLEAEGGWGRFRESLSMEGRHLRFERTVNIEKDVLPAGEFLSIREAVNAARSTMRRSVIVHEGTATEKVAKLGS